MHQKSIKQLVLLMTLAAGVGIAAESRAEPLSNGVALTKNATLPTSPAVTTSADAKVPASSPTSTVTPTAVDTSAAAPSKAVGTVSKGVTDLSATKDTTVTSSPSTLPAQATSPSSKAAPEGLASPVSPNRPAESPHSQPVQADPNTPMPQAPASSPTVVEQNAVTETQVLALAKQAAVAVFNYDYKNYQLQLDGLTKFFTPEGWVAFSDALKRSNNIDEVKKDQITVSSKVMGDVKLLKQEEVKGTKIYKVEVPLTVSYKGLTQNIQQNLSIEIVIVPVPPSISADGIAVTQFIAKTAVPANT